MGFPTSSVIVLGANTTLNWTAFAPSTTGITGESATCFFVQIGQVVWAMYNSSGTGSTTSRTFTLPVSTGANGSAYGGLQYFTRDGGTTATSPGAFTLANNSTICTLYKTMAEAANSWTGSAAWQVNALIVYGIN